MKERNVKANPAYKKYLRAESHTHIKILQGKMYATRRLSELLKSAELVAAPPDGPNSGYLVIDQDEESVTYSCFGCCKINRSLYHLPFPQDKELAVRYTTSSGEYSHTYLHPLFFIPLLNHPLSSNRYHAIQPHGKRMGEAFTSSTEEDKTTGCFCRCIKDLKPRPLDPNNIYQQFEIIPYQVGSRVARGFFLAESTALDGLPPSFLRRKGWTINANTNSPHNFKLDDAPGLDSHLRARLQLLDSPAPTVIGKWYSPFIFVKERTIRDQVKQSMYYEVTLEQRWEQIFRCGESVGNSVVIDTSVEKEQVFVGGSRARWKEQSAVDGVVWYEVDGGGGVGLRVELVERMKWEQKRGGWMGGGGGEEREVKIKKVEEWKEGGSWNELRCYVLVETFNLRRMDGSLVMSYHFKYFHNLKTTWE